MDNKEKELKADEKTDLSVYLSEDSYVDAEESVEDEPNEVSTAETVADELLEEALTGTEKEPKAEKEVAPEDKKPKKLKIWWEKRNKWQKALIIICAILLAIAIAAGVFIWQKLSLIDTDGEDDFGGDVMLEDDIDVSQMNGITDASSLNDFLIKWANNGGEKMHSKYVKNVLLIGTRDGLSDSMILISLNERTKQINLVSFYRDSYTYIQPEKKKAQFGKLNAAYAKGGAKCLTQTIEDDYKIEIDDYVVVNTSSFVKVIDALGGVNVNITKKEANYLNATWRQWSFTGNKVSFSEGMNALNGEKALMFCRIRGLDSDINRTERQRRVITGIIGKFKNASVTELNNAINALLPNVKTSMSKSAILGYAADAVSDGWLKFPIAQTSMPTTDTANGGMLGDQWVWIVDYEGAAYQLQTLLYGQSNIHLEPGRVSVLSLKPTAASSNTGKPSAVAPSEPAPSEPASTPAPEDPTGLAPDAEDPTEPQEEPNLEPQQEEPSDSSGGEQNFRDISNRLHSIVDGIRK